MVAIILILIVLVVLISNIKIVPQAKAYTIGSVPRHMADRSAF